MADSKQAPLDSAAAAKAAFASVQGKPFPDDIFTAPELRWAVIGCGVIANQMAQSLALAGRKLAAGQREGLGHLVGDNATTDHSPTKLGCRKDVIGEWLTLDRSERCLCGCRGVEWSLLGICHMCLLSHRKFFISNSLIFAQMRAHLLVFACLFVYRSLFSHILHIFTRSYALTRNAMRDNAHARILTKHKETEHQSPKDRVVRDTRHLRGHRTSKDRPELPAHRERPHVPLSLQGCPHRPLILVCPQ